MKFLILASILINISVIAQNRQILDNLEINDNTRIIGIYPQSDESKTYENLNFYIDNKEIIKSIKSKLIIGEKVKNRYEMNALIIIVLDGNEIIEDWTVSPKYSNILINGEYFSFDPEILKSLSEKHPLKYSFRKIFFSKSVEYEDYKKEIISNRSFLFNYPPIFSFEGSFEITFPKNSEFENFKMTYDFLIPRLNKMVNNEKEYRISYGLDERNIKNKNAFIITIECSRDLFEKFKLKKYPKENWRYTKYNGVFFFKENE